MSHIKGDNWIVEIKAVRAIRTDKYGSPFTATITFTNINGEWYAENMLNRDGEPFTKRDYKEIRELARKVGIKKLNLFRFNKKLERVEKLYD